MNTIVASKSDNIAQALQAIIEPVLAIILLVVLSPIYLALAITIRATSAGPAVFKQTRSGQYGKEFTMYKFRSMTHNHKPKDALDYVFDGDPRITKIGAFLRKTSLDELPQLFNIIKGEMSFVGPRPQPANYIEHYAGKVKGYRERLQVKPGVTGPVQISKLRQEVDTIEGIQERVDLENKYVKSKDAFIDMKIVVLTLVMIIFKTKFSLFQ